jgi:hypothetical protein
MYNPMRPELTLALHRERVIRPPSCLALAREAAGSPSRQPPPLPHEAAYGVKPQIT